MSVTTSHRSRRTTSDDGTTSSTQPHVSKAGRRSSAQDAFLQLLVTQLQHQDPTSRRRTASSSRSSRSSARSSSSRRCSRRCRRSARRSACLPRRRRPTTTRDRATHDATTYRTRRNARRLGRLPCRDERSTSQWQLVLFRRASRVSTRTARYLSVIGNNLANINTVGFKASSVTFQDLVSQTVGGSSVNPMQVGLGVTTGSISPVFSQGAIENTREATNVAIQGNGFFVVRGDGGNSYTRAGNFTLRQRRQAGDARRPVRPGLHADRRRSPARSSPPASRPTSRCRPACCARRSATTPIQHADEPRRRGRGRRHVTRPPCRSTTRSARRTSRRSPTRRRRPAAGATRSPCPATEATGTGGTTAGTVRLGRHRHGHVQRPRARMTGAGRPTSRWPAPTTWTNGATSSADHVGSRRRQRRRRRSPASRRRRPPRR